MTGTLKTKVKKPCKCGHNRWKTVCDVDYAMITKYQCRKCGIVRNVTRMEVVDGN